VHRYPKTGHATPATAPVPASGGFMCMIFELMRNLVALDIKDIESEPSANQDPGAKIRSSNPN